MSGCLFPASPSSTTSSRPPWNLPGWHVAFLCFCSLHHSHPAPFSPRLSSFHCELALCSACFPDSLGPVPSGDNSPWGLPISIVFPGCHSWQQLCRADRIGGLFGAPRAWTHSQRGAASWLGLPFRLLGVGLEWTGLAGTNIPSQWPAHLRQRAGGGSAMGTPGCTSAYIKRNVVILCFRERDKWLETKLPGSLGPTLPPFSVLPTSFPSQGKRRTDGTFNLASAGLNVFMKPVLWKGEGRNGSGVEPNPAWGWGDGEDIFFFFFLLTAEQQIGLWVANGRNWTSQLDIPI